MTYHAIHRSERGSALVPSILFAITAMAFAMSIIVSSLAVSHQRRSVVGAQRAQDAAESGVGHLLGALAGPDRLRVLSEFRLEGVLQGDPGSIAAVRYEVSIEPAGNDGADNDLDGLVDEPDEADMYEATSTGYADRIEKTVRVTILARYRSPNVPAATYIADPYADINFSGNAFLISGIDVDTDLTKTGSLVPGIGVPGSPTTIRDQLKKQQDDNVVGTGGEPSVQTVDQIDFTQLIEDAVRSANVVLQPDSTQKPAKEGDWGTLATPAILFGSGDITISGGASGAGVLVVDGNLTISGSFEWQGLIIARGKVLFAGGGGDKRIVGGVVVEKDVLSSADSTSSSGFGSGNLAVNGTVDVLYSEATLSIISRAFATYTILNWREGPNPPAEAGS